MGLDPVTLPRARLSGCVREGRSLTGVCSRRTKLFMSWTCPKCDRTFRQVNQRHACGVGSPATLLKSRPPALTDLYRKLETTVRGFGKVEVVTRNRYALFRTTRIFVDLTVMRDALRVVIHLGRKAGAPYFIKIVQGDKRVSHVALVRTAEDLRTIIPLLREAFDLAMSEES
jgi:predicted transport protein